MYNHLRSAYCNNISYKNEPLLYINRLRAIKLSNKVLNKVIQLFMSTDNWIRTEVLLHVLSACADKVNPENLVSSTG